MNTGKKGLKNEKYTRDFYEQCGYTTEFIYRSKYGPNDFFGIADFIAIQKGKKPIFVQVKSNIASGKNKYLKQAIKLLPLEYVNFDLAVVHDGKRGVPNSKALRIFRIKGDKFKKVRDNRT